MDLGNGMDLINGFLVEKLRLCVVYVVGSLYHTLMAWMRLQPGHQQVLY